MPPNRFSRHRFCTAQLDDDGRLYLSDRDPYGYHDFPDNRLHPVSEGDTLWNLAGFYFKGMPNAGTLWWVIADFQPDPIHDPTVELEPGTVLYVPSLRTVQEEILNERRRDREGL